MHAATNKIAFLAPDGRTYSHDFEIRANPWKDRIVKYDMSGIAYYTNPGEDFSCRCDASPVIIHKRL